MKRLIVGVVLVLSVGIVAVGAAFASRDGGGHFREYDYAVTINFPNDQLKVGENPVSVTVRDNAGNVVSDAPVTIKYDMEGMHHDSKTILQAGAYTGDLNFSMPGEWTIQAQVVKAGRGFTASCTKNVVR